MGRLRPGRGVTQRGPEAGGGGTSSAGSRNPSDAGQGHFWCPKQATVSLIARKTGMMVSFMQSDRVTGKCMRRGAGRTVV